VETSQERDSCDEDAVSHREWLIEFESEETDVGVVPPSLHRVTTWTERQDALTAGGIDVSDDPAAWRRYLRYVNSVYECLI
jgi:hypothetical protein